VSLPKPAAEVVEALAAKGIIAGYAPRDAGEENTLLITATEVTTDSDIDALVDSLKEVLA
jgi:glycine dehydrogenase subunit 1